MVNININNFLNGRVPLPCEAMAHSPKSTSATMTLAKQEQVLHITLWRYWQVWDYVLVPLTQKKKSIIDLHKLWMSLMVFVRIKGWARVHSWMTQICTHGYFKFKMPYLDLCGFQPLDDSELWGKNSWVLKCLWSTDTWKYLQVLRVLNWNKID